MTTSAVGHIVSELNRRGIRYKLDEKNVLVWCPFHGGSPYKLKLGIHKSGRYGNCWVCGKGRGGWNEYAKKIGLNEIDFDDPNIKNDYTELSMEIEEFEKREKHEHALPAGLQPWTEEWKRFGNGEDFDPRFLATVPSYEWYDSDSETYRILWPVTMNGALSGWIAARNNEETLPKYRNSSLLNASRVFFPFDHPVLLDENKAYKKQIVLVEGPASALRLLSEGIPAVAILGVKNWNKSKIPYLVARGYVKVVLALDGDDEGWECTRQIYRDIKSIFDTRVIEFPDGADPANCTRKYIKLIQRLLNDNVQTVAEASE